MKKHIFLALLTSLFIFSTGCSKYDYWEDKPDGYYDTAMPDAVDSIELPEYHGENVPVQSELLSLDSPQFNDSVIQIISGERRYSKYVIYCNFNSSSVLDNFTMLLNYYDDEGKLIDTVFTENHYVVGGMLHSILVNLPEGATTFSIESYKGDYLGELQSIQIFDFQESSIIKESTTTYAVNRDYKNVIFLAENNVVVWGHSQIDEGNLIVPRNYVIKFACLEVDDES